MALNEDIHLELCRRAKEAEFGLYCEVENPKQFQIQFATAMSRIGEKDILACIPSIENVVLLTKRSVELD